MPNYPKKINLNHTDRALEELDIDVPIYDIRLVRNRLEVHLYGGRVLLWPPEAPSPAPKKIPWSRRSQEG
jgi:hypothetical protein